MSIRQSDVGDFWLQWRCFPTADGRGSSLFKKSFDFLGGGGGGRGINFSLSFFGGGGGILCFFFLDFFLLARSWSFYNHVF